MEQEKKSFVHDTINLDEIKQLLNDELSQEEIQEPFEQLTVLPEEETSMDQLSMLPEEDEKSLEEEVAAEEEAPLEQLLEEDEPEQPQPRNKKIDWSRELHGMLHDIVYLLAAVTLIFVYVVRLVGVQGESMLPTLYDQDYLLLESNFLYGGSDLKYGDIVVLNVPDFQHGEGPIVKRIIATEGQTVDIDFSTGSVYVDGALLKEDYINELTFLEEGTEFPLTVPENSVFVMGDNRNHSSDSRDSRLGTVDERYVIGKAVFLAFPGADQYSGERSFGRIGGIR